MSQSANKCYASVIGQCSPDRSGEHVITRGIFGDGNIRTRNLRSPDDQDIGIDSLTANILCKSHNSVLGKLDDEVKRLSDAILAWRSVNAPRSIDVNGYLIERWLLKTLAGILLSGWLKVKLEVPKQLIMAIFGLKRLHRRDALYHVVNVPIQTEHEKLVFFEFFKDDNGEPITGGIFLLLHGMPLVFANRMFDPQSTLRECKTVLGFDVTRAELRRHAAQIIMTGSQHGSKLTTNFEWSSRFRPEI